jgi:CHASE3 domain sensor protein
MRSRVPPLLPTYVLLVLAVAFAVGSLRVGLDRLEAIDRLAASRAESAATVQDLQSLQSTLNEFVVSVQAYRRTGLDRDRELFEQAQRRVPAQLSALRDRMRESPMELALVERLVPLIARTTALANGMVEQASEAPAPPQAPDAPAPYLDSVESIRAIIADLEKREQEQLVRDGSALTAAISTATILQYTLAVLIVLLVALLFVAARRLSSFIPPAPREGTGGAVELDDESVDASNARIAMLLDNAMARARLAAATTPPDDPAAAGPVRSTLQAIGRAPLPAPGPPRPGTRSVADGLAFLARTYSQAGAFMVEPTLDMSVEIPEREKAFVIDRVAEWGLEAIAVRKRGGDVSLLFTAKDRDASLRILALLDHPDLPLRFSPREREEAAFLRRAAASLGGRFVVTHGPTGFALVLSIPLDS